MLYCLSQISLISGGEKEVGRRKRKGGDGRRDSWNREDRKAGGKGGYERGTERRRVGMERVDKALEDRGKLKENRKEKGMGKRKE